MSLPELPRILPPETLLAHLDDEGLMIVDVGSMERYLRAHLPGALAVTPGELVSGEPPASGRLPSLERLEALFARLGWSGAAHVVAYDDEGGGWAGRFLWTLDVIGHERWSYLDGGLRAWHAIGGPLSERVPTPAPADVRLEIHDAPIAEAADVLAAIDDPDSVVWDARSPEEYRGEKVSARRGGHVPGAVNLDWLELMDRERDLRLREDLAQLLADRGIAPGMRIITHCQTHHRSGLSYLVTRALGFADVRGYHGSWSEWGNRDDLPVRAGPEP